MELAISISNNNILIRDEVNRIDEVPHGSTSRGDIYDFSSSVVPIKIPFNEIIDYNATFRYPDSENSVFRASISQLFDISTNNIICGNGSSELLWYIGLAFIPNRAKTIIMEPTFGEYQRIVTMMGGEIYTHKLEEKNQFSLDKSSFTKDCRGKDIIFICNPNNPTGEFLPFDFLEEIAGENPKSLIVVDCAYFDYVGNLDNYTKEFKRLYENYNIIFLFSLTKSFGIAGLRSGYCIGRRDFIKLLERVKIPWNMNHISQSISSYIIKNRSKYLSQIEVIKFESDKLREEIDILGFETIHSSTDYFMVKINNHKKFKEVMLSKGFLIRDLSSMGVGDFIRVTGKDKETNSRFINQLKTIDYKLYIK